MTAADEPTCDCEDCGQAIPIAPADGRIQPDADVSCPGCGAIHVVQVGEEPEHDYWLSISKRGAEVIAEMRTGLERESIYVAQLALQCCPASTTVGCIQCSWMRQLSRRLGDASKPSAEVRP